MSGINQPDDPHFARYPDGLPVNKCACGHHAFDHLSAHIDGEEWGVACTRCDCKDYRPIDEAMRKTAGRVQ